MFDNLSDTNLVEQRRGQLVGSATKQYDDLIAQLQKQKQIAESQFGSSKNLSQQQLEMAKGLATNQAIGQEGQARQTYNDLITQARERARAMGGVTGSGVESMYGGVDKNLQQNLYNIGNTRTQTIGQAQLSYDQQLNQLQSELDKQVMAIESDRTKSLREKNDLISNIEMQALAKADSIRKAKAASGVGSYGYVGGNTSTNVGGNVLGDFTIDVPTNEPAKLDMQDAVRMGESGLYNALTTNPGQFTNPNAAWGEWRALKYGDWARNMTQDQISQKIKNDNYNAALMAGRRG